LDIAHEHMFSCTTPGVEKAVTREQAVVVEHMTITTVDCNHTGMYMSKHTKVTFVQLSPDGTC